MWTSARMLIVLCSARQSTSAIMDLAVQHTRYQSAVRLRKLVRQNSRIWCGAYGTQGKPGTILLVESPAKARKIQGFLGEDYKVLPSYGHVRDLPSKAGAVQPTEGFAMQWELLGDAKTRVRELAQEVKGANKLILATDPDREGEAISWHVLQEMQARNALDGVVVERITFTEVTQSAIKQALQQPRSVSMSLVDAYLARRALDYLVGFNISPVLWRKLPGSKSAGRVQSVALRLICQREDEIDRFVSQEYWSVTASLLTSTGDVFSAELTHFEGKKLGKMGLDKATALKAAARIQSALFKVQDVTGKEVQRSPSPPFITSTLQIEASRRLGMSTQRTMSAAQSLYEGSDAGEGLITYLRTDGLHVAPSAITGIRDAVTHEFGPSFVPPTPRVYKSKLVNAQEAHEAIRPTKMHLTPKMLEGKLARDELRLYRLIWTRTAASQMSQAKLKQVAAVLQSEGGDVTLRASGSHVVFPGYLQAYDDGEVLTDSSESGEAADASPAKSATAKKGQGSIIDKILADLKVGAQVSVREVLPEEHHTKPPGRFSEGSLVKELESLSIGRPSTYASIIRVLLQRGYVDKVGQSLKPSAKGRVVTGFLVEYFKRYMDYDFTAYMESQLDEISASRVDWLAVMTNFWGPFHTSVEEAISQRNSLVYSHLDKTLEHLLYPPRADGSDPRTCPACGAPLHLKVGKGGPFVGCTNYEKKTKKNSDEELKSCSYARPIGEDPLGSVSDGVSDIRNAGGSLTNGRLLGPHPVTGDIISVRNGPFGLYLQVGEATESNPRPKRVTIKGIKDVSGFTLDQAVSLLGEERMVGLHPDDSQPITSGTGQYGPYVSHKGIYAALKKGQEVETVTLEAAVQLLAAKRERMLAKAEAAGKKLLGNSEKVAKKGQGKGRKRAAGTDLEAEVKKSKSASKSKAAARSKSKLASNADSAESDSGTPEAKPRSKGKPSAEAAAANADSQINVADSAVHADSAKEKPVPGHVLWMREEKAKVAREQPHLTPAAVLKIVREGWKTLDPAVKEQYKQRGAVQPGPSTDAPAVAAASPTRAATAVQDSFTQDSQSQHYTQDSQSQQSTQDSQSQQSTQDSQSQQPTLDSRTRSSDGSGSGSASGSRTTKPGKGLLAYALFVREEKERQMDSDPDVKPGEAAKRAREVWKTLDANTKEQYTLRAAGNILQSPPTTEPMPVAVSAQHKSRTARSKVADKSTGVPTGTGTAVNESGVSATSLSDRIPTTPCHEPSSMPVGVITPTKKHEVSGGPSLDDVSAAVSPTSSSVPAGVTMATKQSEASNKSSSDGFAESPKSSSMPAGRSVKAKKAGVSNESAGFEAPGLSNQVSLKKSKRGRPSKQAGQKATTVAAGLIESVTSKKADTGMHEQNPIPREPAINALSSVASKEEDVTKCQQGSTAVTSSAVVVGRVDQKEEDVKTVKQDSIAGASTADTFETLERRQEDAATCKHTCIAGTSTPAAVENVALEVEDITLRQLSSVAAQTSTPATVEAVARKDQNMTAQEQNSITGTASAASVQSAAVTEDDSTTAQQGPIAQVATPAPVQSMAQSKEGITESKEGSTAVAAIPNLGEALAQKEEDIMALEQGSRAAAAAVDAPLEPMALKEEDTTTPDEGSIRTAAMSAPVDTLAPKEEDVTAPQQASIAAPAISGQLGTLAPKEEDDTINQQGPIAVVATPATPAPLNTTASIEKDATSRLQASPAVVATSAPVDTMASKEEDITSRLQVSTAKTVPSATVQTRSQKEADIPEELKSKLIQNGKSEPANADAGSITSVAETGTPQQRAFQLAHKEVSSAASAEADTPLQSDVTQPTDRNTSLALSAAEADTPLQSETTQPKDNKASPAAFDAMADTPLQSDIPQPRDSKASAATSSAEADKPLQSETTQPTDSEVGSVSSPAEANPALQSDATQPADSPAPSPALKEAESVLSRLQASVRNLKERVLNDFERQEGTAKELEEQMSLAGKFWKRMTGGIIKPPKSK